MAIAGLVVNGAAALVVVAVARLVTPQSYGAIAQLLGLFFILSMPGSAVLVGVVRRVTALQNAGRGASGPAVGGQGAPGRPGGIALEVVVVLLLQGWIARQLSLPNSDGVVLILVAAGIWILLCVDRGLLQAHRSYRALAGNLLVEGGVRTFLVIVLVVAHLGVAGYALGRVHQRGGGHPPRPLAGQPGLVGGSGPGIVAVAADAVADTSLARHKLMADVSAAFVGPGPARAAPERRRHPARSAGPCQRGSVRRHLGGIEGPGVRRPGPGGLPPPRGHHPLERGGPRHPPAWGSPSSSWPCRPGVLLAIAVFIPRWFLTLVFSAKLSSAAPAFAALVVAMMCLSFSVWSPTTCSAPAPVGSCSCWPEDRCWPWLLVGHRPRADGGHRPGRSGGPGTLALAMGIAFVAIHHKHHRSVVVGGGCPAPSPSCPGIGDRG